LSYFPASPSSLLVIQNNFVFSHTPGFNSSPARRCKNLIFVKIDNTNAPPRKEKNASAITVREHDKLNFVANKFTIGLIQMRSSPDPAENLPRAIAKIREAASHGAQIVCLHELFRSEYFCRTENPELFNLAEPIPGPSTDSLAQVAKERKVVLVVSLFERRAPGVYHNTCAVLDADGSFLGKYRKMHIPDDPLYYEKFYFTPGDLGFPNFDTTYGRIGVQICWDQWYPEGSRLTALQGAQVIFYPTSIGWHPHEKAQFGAAQLDAWRTIQRGHAIANGVYVAVVNRVGYEGKPQNGDPGLEFWGNSFVADPFGQIVAEASNDKEEILVIECDPAKTEETRRNWPFLRDRRIDAYPPILNRWLGE
jgi:N-carbamoylputrescine amidase